MNRQIKQVAQFNKSFKVKMPKGISMPDNDTLEMRQRILQEEIDELNAAQKSKNIVEVADAIIDCMYILIGTAEAFGLSQLLEPMFDEVHRSNMSKLDAKGKPIYREDGKVLKGVNYTRPQLDRIIYEHMKY